MTEFAGGGGDAESASRPERSEAVPYSSTEKISIKTLLAYGIGQGGEGVVARSLDTLLLFFYSQVLGLPATLVGFVALVALCTSAGLDIVVGILSDNWKSRFGRRHPFMYAAVIPFGVSFALIFCIPRSLNAQQSIWWLVASMALLRFAMALYHVPHMAQGAELSDEYSERSKLAASRVGFSTAANFLVNIVGFGYFFRATAGYSNGQLNPNAYGMFGVFFSLVIVAAILTSALGTHGSIGRLHSAAARSLKASALDVGKSLLDVVRLRSYRTMISEMIVYFVAAGIFSSALLYLYTYFWELEPAQIAIVSIAQPLGLLIGFLVVGPLGRRFDKRTIMIAGIVVATIFQVGPIALRLCGLAPQNGTDVLLALLIFAQAIYGMASMQRVSTGASIMADVADELEHVAGTRQEGAVFAGLSIAQTIAGGVGTFLLALMLDAVGFPQHARGGSVPRDVVDHLGIDVVVSVLLFSIGAIGIVSRLDLGRERHAVLLGELRNRRGARVSG